MPGKNSDRGQPRSSHRKTFHTGQRIRGADGMTPLRLARLSLTRHLFATAITVAAIGLSVACGGILLRLYLLSESRFEALGRAGDAIVGAKAGGIEILLGSANGEGAYPDYLPYKLFETLRAQQNVQFE